MTTDYHSWPDDLFEFIGTIEKHKQDVEKDIIKELEEHMGSLIERGKDREVFRGAKVKLLLPGGESQSEASEVTEEAKKKGKRHR